MKSGVSGHQARRNCSLCPIHNRAVCSVATPESVAMLNRISQSRHYSAGQTIMHEQGDASLVGNVISGCVKISRTLEDGRVQVVGLLLPSDFLGRPFREASRFLFEAATDTSLCVMDRVAFESILQHHPELMHGLLVNTLDELDSTREWMVLLGCQNVREKVAGFLLLLLRRTLRSGCEHHERVPAARVRLPINRRDMASYLGTTVETISRQIQALSREGVLEIVDSREFDILKPERLAAVAAHDEWLSDFSAI